MQSKKPDEWRKRIEEWKQSGVSQAVYCREHNLALATFGYWKRKLERGNPQLRLVPIDRSAGRIPGRAGIRLEIHGAILEIGPDSDIHILTRVLEVLARSSCGT